MKKEIKIQAIIDQVKEFQVKATKNFVGHINEDSIQCIQSAMIKAAASLPSPLSNIILAAKEALSEQSKIKKQVYSKPTVKGVKYKIAIRKNDTGEIKVRDIDSNWDETSFYWLTEGNFGCDCNRAWLFHKDGHRVTETANYYCSMGGYTILHAELEDGTNIKIDR